MKRKIMPLVIIVLVALTMQGCAVVMAARQPGKKDISLFKKGTLRSALIAEFGAPTVSEERNGKKYEIFKFTQGYNAPTKVGRALFHGAADFFSLGLWEVVGTPTEMVLDGTAMAYEVSYDENNRIDTLTLIKKEGTKNPEIKNEAKEVVPEKKE